MVVRLLIFIGLFTCAQAHAGTVVLFNKDHDQICGVRVVEGPDAPMLPRGGEVTERPIPRGWEKSYSGLVCYKLPKDFNKCTPENDDWTAWKCEPPLEGDLTKRIPLSK